MTTRPTALVRGLAGSLVVAVSLGVMSLFASIYYIPLAIFGVTMSLARWATPTRSIGTSIGAHLAGLTVVRIALPRDADAAGWSMALLMPDAILLIPLLLVAAGLGFFLLGRRAPRNR